MRNVLVIARRDIGSAFVTPVAYVVLTGFMLLSGFFFFTLLQNFNAELTQSTLMKGPTPNLNEWVVYPFFQTLQIVLIFLVPILTMRSIAEEKRAGTFELLSTSPVSAGEIVLGKFIALAVVSGVMLMLSFIFPAVLVFYADPETAPVLVACLGMLLFTFSFVSIGLAVSATTKSQTVAGVVGLVLLLIFYVIDAPAQQLGGTVAQVFRYLSPSLHADLLLKGVLQSSDLVYFLSVIFTGIFVANRVLDAQRWR